MIFDKATGTTAALPLWIDIMKPYVERRRKELGEPPIFALGLDQSEPKCLVEQAVNAGLEGAMAESRRLLLERFATIRMDQLARDFQERLKLHPHCPER